MVNGRYSVDFVAFFETAAAALFRVAACGRKRARTWSDSPLGVAGSVTRRGRIHHSAQLSVRQLSPEELPRAVLFSANPDNASSGDLAIM